MIGESNEIECRKCGTLNSSSASICSACGHAIQGGFPMLTIGAAILAVLCVVYFAVKDTLLGAQPEPSPAIAISPSPAIAISPSSSSSSFGSKEPLVEGVIVRTYQDITDVPHVPNGMFNYGGSTTFAPLRKDAEPFKSLGMLDVVDTIELAHPVFQLRYTNPISSKPGSGTGIKMLVQGQLSFSESSRPVKTEEFDEAQRRGFRLEQIPVAIDGIAVYVNPELINQGLEGLTLTQVKDIFTGKVKNWKDLGGPDLEIIPFSRNLKAGGTVDFFSEQILEDEPLGPNVQEVEDTTMSIQNVSKTPGGIGYATASEVDQQAIQVLPLAKSTNSSFVSPCADQACTVVNKADFVSGEYPVTRRLFVVIKRDGGLDEQAGVAYANMLLSDEGQKLIEQAGFVSIRSTEPQSKPSTGVRSDGLVVAPSSQSNTIWLRNANR